MHLRTAFLALCLLTSTVHPFPHSSSSLNREDQWDYQNVNRVSDKAQKPRTETTSHITFLKSHLDSRNLFAHDALQGQSHLAEVEEVRRKLRAEPERLYMYLMQELSKLQEKLSLYTTRSEHSPARYQSHPMAHARRLGTLFSSSVRELCSRLQQHVHSLEATSNPSSYQEAELWINQVLEQGVQDLRLHLDEFDESTSRVADELDSGGKDERWRKAAARMGRKVEEAAHTLRATAADLLTSSGGPDEQLSQTVARFCSSSMAQIETFSTWVEQNADHAMEPSRTQGTHEHRTMVTLDEDFSTRLNALLTEIRQILS